MTESSRSGRPHAPKRPRRTGTFTPSQRETPRERKPRESGSSDERKPREAVSSQGRKTREAASSRQQHRARFRERQALRSQGRTAGGEHTTDPEKHTSGRERTAGRDRKNSRRVREGRSFLVGGLEISVRFLVVGMLAAVLGVLLIPNLVQWWNQEQDLRDIKARVAAAQERNKQMERDLDLWKNPDYIASQARERLGYVKRGETQYTVVDPGDDYQDEAQVNAAPDAGPARPWLQVVGILLHEADQPQETAQPVSGLNEGQSADSSSAPQKGQ
ncbi:septum formation initiator family protein [Schaalia sp. ZJ405]|uniref:FtsB family cell division protein n=1 Tax=Schaalia sp. ZJ405 TaxID=2709403 RepID=UPI0013EB2EEC|nr:septum formation initiator family protein [Schaalia sp. ZJ405]QPK80871.1 septum formation initiator family protein [Schaalia sp. ZJ405]